MRDEQDVATAIWRVSPDPMCILDRQGRFVALNPAWHTVLGWTEQDMLGRAYQDFLHPNDVKPSEKAFEQVLRGEPVLRFENRYKSASGSFRWLSWVCVPEGDNFYSAVRDVTDDKRRKKRIKDQEREARLREQFLAILGHDLRSPLASMTSGVRLLSKQDQTEQGRTILRNMSASSRRMAELINNLMDLARLQLGGGIVIERAQVTDLAERITQIATEIETATECVTIRQTLEIPGAVECDAPRLMQVVSNLLANAVAHGSPGVPIDLTVRHDSGRLILSVCNMGEPISQKTLDTLFEPFFKGTRDQAENGGLGLGLYICAQIVAAHNGTIDATSQDGRTCFTVEIPG